MMNEFEEPLIEEEIPTVGEETLDLSGEIPIEEPPIEEPVIDEEEPIEEPEDNSLSDEEIEGQLASLIQKLESKDASTRSNKMRRYRRNEYYWQGHQKIYWDSGKSSYLTEDGEVPLDTDNQDENVNIYKGYGLSVVAALSTGIPKPQFFPDDANNPNDITTAKSMNHLAEMIQNHNSAETQVVEDLVILWKQPFVAVYAHFVRSDEYGSEIIEQFAPVQYKQFVNACPQCGMSHGEGQSKSTEPSAPTPIQCQCGYTGPATEADVNEFEQIEKVGQEEVPKGRVVLEHYGPMNVRIPAMQRIHPDSSKLPYICLELEEDYAYLQELYPSKVDKIGPGTSDENRDSRIDPLLVEDLDSEKPTWKRWWINPWAFNYLAPEVAKVFKEKYPKGVRIACVENNIVEVVEESLNTCWVLSLDPTNVYFHQCAYGDIEIPMQDMYNDAYSAIVQSMRYAIPEIFADQKVLNFEAYSEKTSTPGGITPVDVSKLNGMGLGNAFYETKASVVPREYEAFLTRLGGPDSQFLLGAYPSVFGGPAGAGTKTLGEYEQSKQMSLQRLSILWKIINNLWYRLYKRACIMYRDNMLNDEQFTQRDQAKGSFSTTVISRAELAAGKIGNADPEISEQFPTSWAQKRALILEMLNFKNPMIDGIIQHPANAGLAAYLGFPEIYVPGQDDRVTQLKEIQKISSGEMVPVNQELDDHFIHAEIAKSWLNSSVGREKEELEPEVFQMVMQHFMEHKQIIAQQEQAAMQQQAATQQPPQKGVPENGNPR